jgi:hypothetical protein
MTEPKRHPALHPMGDIESPQYDSSPFKLLISVTYDADSATVITPNDINLAIEAMKDPDQFLGDEELLHRIEDELHEIVLRSIADGRCSDPAACSRIAMLTCDMEFSRWYA